MKLGSNSNNPAYWNTNIFTEKKKNKKHLQSVEMSNESSKRRWLIVTKYALSTIIY